MCSLDCLSAECWKSSTGESAGSSVTKAVAQQFPRAETNRAGLQRTMDWTRRSIIGGLRLTLMRASRRGQAHSRRFFLQLTGAGLLCAGPAGPQLQFPTEPRQRLAVTSYPFRAYIESPTNPGRDKSKPGMDLKEFPAMVVKRFQVHSINPLGDHLSSIEDDYLKAFRKAVEAAGSQLVDLGLSGRDFSHPNKANRDEAVAYGRKWIDIAARIGSPSVRRGASPRCCW